MPWVKGQSGCPGGRGKPRLHVPMLQAEAEKMGKLALATLERHMTRDDGGDPRLAALSVAACKEILDRAGLTPEWAQTLAMQKMEAALTVPSLPQAQPTPELESGLGPSDPLN